MNRGDEYLCEERIDLHKRSIINRLPVSLRSSFLAAPNTIAPSRRKQLNAFAFLYLSAPTIDCVSSGVEITVMQ